MHVHGRVVAQVSEIAGNTASRETHYLHDDHLGSTHVVTDASGNEVQRTQLAETVRKASKRRKVAGRKRQRRSEEHIRSSHPA